MEFWEGRVCTSYSLNPYISETNNGVCIMNKLKFFCAGVDSHINKFYSAFHTLKDFT